MRCLSFAINRVNLLRLISHAWSPLYPPLLLAHPVIISIIAICQKFHFPTRQQDINDQLEKPTMEGIQIGTTELMSHLELYSEQPNF